MPPQTANCPNGLYSNDGYRSPIGSGEKRTLDDNEDKSQASKCHRELSSLLSDVQDDETGLAPHNGSPLEDSTVPLAPPLRWHKN